MPLASGTRLGTYEILALLGVGGMGEVYRARDLRLGREIALKVLPADVSADPGRLARFEREARTVAGLNHPNIVTLFSVEDDGEIRFLTMELVEGQSLDHSVMPGGLPISRVIELGIALADALVAAHAKGVVHRDLKPANVMVTKEGRVKVLDFGLAKPVARKPGPASSQSPTVDSQVSGAGVFAGTPSYMAPEQVWGEAADARTDLFALGILLYELATGKRPFAGDTPVDICRAILLKAPAPLAAARADLPADLDRIVRRCLEKSPGERFQTALDVSNELRNLRKELERRGLGAVAKAGSDKVVSIAVLPFMNRSASAEDEYFSDGLADELLSVLAKIKGLRVTARSSAFSFKGRQATAAEIGRALDVETLLEGSVRKAGNRIRVSVQLVQVSDSSHLWSESYDRTLEDIFAVQDDIAHSVVKELRTMLLGAVADSDASGQVKADVAQAAKGRGTDPEAHRLYLLAKHLIDRATRPDTVKAVEYLTKALARDPEYALAWALLCGAHTMGADRGWAPVAEGYGQARDAANRALALEPDLPEGHARLGWIRMSHDWDFQGAEASFARALELAPGNAEVLRGAGVLSWILGRIEEGILLYRRAVEQDPLSAGAYHNLGYALHHADRFAEAEAAYRKSLELAPQRAVTRANLALVLMALGRGEEAPAETLREPDEWARLWALAIAYHASGHRAEADTALQELIEKYGGDSAYQIAEVHGTRSEVEQAFEWLERAYAQRDSGLAGMKPNAHLRSLRHDPRWGAFLKKVGLED